MMQAEDSRMYWCKGTIRDRWMAKRKKLVAALAEIINKGVAEGKVRTDVRPEALASFLLALLRTRSRDLTDVPEIMERHELLVDLFLTGAAQYDELGNNNKSRMNGILYDQYRE
jgi:hypothetical protein